MVDELRANLTRRLQADKEYKLQQQREEYEEKIRALKEKYKARSKEKPSKRPTIFSPRQLQQQIAKGKEEVEEYKTAKFQQSAPYRYGKIISKSIFRTHRPDNRLQRKPILFRGRRAASSSRFAKSPSPSFQSPEARRQAYLRLLMRQAMNRGWSPNDLDSVAWSDFFQTRMMEFEMNQPRLRNIAVGTAWLPASEVKTMEGEIGLHNRRSAMGGSFISRESLGHARQMDIDPTLQLEKEVNFFSNVLTPRRPAPRRRTRRRR